MFCIITDDNDKIFKKPKNVFFVNKTIQQIQKSATQKLGFLAKLSQGYKICDFRPSLGYLFPELIKGFEFWGYGDIDVIYGKLRNFLTAKLLDSYDIFSFRPEYLSGCFTILRNTKKMNGLFMQSKDYKTVLSKRKYFNFDECNFMFTPLQAGASIDAIPYKLESMTHVVIRKANEGFLRAYFDFNLLEGPVGNVKWIKGKIIYKSQFEAILYHFLKFKDHYKNKNRIIPTKENETIYFSQNNIYKRKNK